jgi:hypothetical protein
MPEAQPDNGAAILGIVQDNQVEEQPRYKTSTHSEEVYQPPYRLPVAGLQKHSGLGIASFVIAGLVGGLDVILAVVIATGIARSGPRRAEIVNVKANIMANAVAGGVAMYCMNCMSIPLCLVGVGLAVAALVSERGQYHLFTWIGLLGNGVIIVGVVGLYLLGAMMSD